MGTLHLDIDEAVQQGHIRPYYQPIVRVETGKCCAFEALARWQHPEHGLLMPGAFVPPLEQSDQIHKLDSTMMGAVCCDINSCHDAGIPMVPVSVNLSRADFSHGDTTAELIALLNSHGVPENRIVIEMTETAAGEGGVIDKRMRAFKDAGFSVWMDDFGTGYSSLSALCELDFDGIKVDMQFLMSQTHKARVVVKHSIAMARELGIGTLAEGVTTQDDLDFLREIGCERAQGSFFSQPRPLDELFDHLVSREIPLETRRP